MMSHLRDLDLEVDAGSPGSQQPAAAPDNPAFAR